MAARRATSALPVTPPVERDDALMLPAGVTAAAVADVLRRGAGALLERVEVFDEYRGPGIPTGHRSGAWHCTFRDPARTLRGQEGEQAPERGLRAPGDELWGGRGRGWYARR